MPKPTARWWINERERIAYLRSLAILGESEGQSQRAMEHLHEVWALAERIGLPGELWHIQSRIGELHERQGDAADCHGHEEHGDVHEQVNNDEAAADEIEYPLTPVESNTAAGEGSSTTVLEGVALDELLSHGSKHLNVHAAGSGDPPQLTCANLR